MAVQHSGLYLGLKRLVHRDLASVEINLESEVLQGGDRLHHILSAVNLEAPPLEESREGAQKPRLRGGEQDVIEVDARLHTRMEADDSGAALGGKYSPLARSRTNGRGRTSEAVIVSFQCEDSYELLKFSLTRALLGLWISHRLLGGGGGV